MENDRPAVSKHGDISLVLNGTRNELCPDVAWSEYKDLVGLNPSTIAHGVEPSGSMLALKHNWDNERADTPDFQWGRAVHCLLFEPKEFDRRYASWEGRRAGNAYKEFVSECWELGKEVLTDQQIKTAIAAASRFVENRLVRHLISAGKPEVTLFYVEDGVQCRGRVDWISSSEHVLVDLKTAKSIQAKLFGRDFFKYHYDVKLGLYRRWLQKLTGERWSVKVVCIEKTPPYDITVLTIPDAVLDQGEDRGRVTIRRVKECIAANVWPGIAGDEEYYLEVPYAEMDEDELEGAEEVEGDT